MENIAVALVYAVAAVGASIGLGIIGAATMSSAGRNPEAIGQLRTLMVTAFVFVEALAIIGLLVALILKFV